MLIVRRLKADQLDLIRPLPDKQLVSEEALLKIGRMGFQLGYTPLPKAEWRSFPPVAYADPLIITQDEGSAFYAAFEDDRYIGCAAVTTLPSGWADVLDLRVDASYRRRGAGKMLLEKCEHFARKHDLSGLRIACTDTNPGMCQFCEHTGFTLAGLDRMALAQSPEERVKPISRRACLLFFYRTIQKG
ncbi:MAG: GNAT family N-acetyltransferase [Clostridia bacterium]|nr:GNAT family N-acetyltransferase [Clostridia bacterium]